VQPHGKWDQREAKRERQRFIANKTRRFKNGNTMLEKVGGKGVDCGTITHSMSKKKRSEKNETECVDPWTY